MNDAVFKTSYGASAEAIQSHYDVSNDFYKLWLDPSMTYSSALWYGDEDLSAAQMNKIDWHISRSGIKKGERLLDVGCGWGALLERAVKIYGVGHAVGLTFSKAQAQYIKQKALFNVDVHVESWATHVPEQEYDAIVSIGAFEHFARLDQTPSEKVEGYRKFFDFCRKVLRSRGCLSLQTIVYENSDRRDFSDLISTRIFPESDLPHFEEIFMSVRGLFEVVELRNDRNHYLRTLLRWLAALRSRRQEAVAMVGEETVASYEQYLRFSVVAFRLGGINLARIKMRRLE